MAEEFAGVKFVEMEKDGEVVLVDLNKLLDAVRLGWTLVNHDDVEEVLVWLGLGCTWGWIE